MNAHSRLSYQTHEHRSEHWVVVRGTATCVIEGETVVVGPGESVDVGVQHAHRICNEHDDELVIIEVQRGPYLGEDDIVRLQDDYGRERPSARRTDQSRLALSRARVGQARLPRERARASVSRPRTGSGAARPGRPRARSRWPDLGQRHRAVLGPRGDAGLVADVLGGRHRRDVAGLAPAELEDRLGEVGPRRGRAAVARRCRCRTPRRRRRGDGWRGTSSPANVSRPTWSATTLGETPFSARERHRAHEVVPVADHPRRAQQVVPRRRADGEVAGGLRLGVDPERRERLVLGVPGVERDGAVEDVLRGVVHERQVVLGGDPGEHGRAPRRWRPTRSPGPRGSPRRRRRCRRRR